MKFLLSKKFSSLYLQLAAGGFFKVIKCFSSQDNTVIMEYDDDNEAEQKAKIPKHSRKGFPSVSQRLQPDFNANVAALNLNESNEDSQDQKPTENNILDFKNILKYLPQICILEYLQRTLEFLKGDDEEICLNENGTLGPFRESFLVQIALKNEHLKAPELGPAASIVGGQILDVVEENRQVFRWIHDFEGGTAKNFLVYRKEYISKQKKIEKETGNHQFQAQPSTMSLTIEERQAIPASFRINWLNKTLRFLKDNTQLILKYPDMNITYARFLYSLLCQRNHGNEDIGFGFKSIYAPLFDTMKGLSEVYEFEVGFAEKFGLAQITLEKIPKKKFVCLNPQDKDSISQPHPTTPTKELPKSEGTVQVKSKPDKNEVILNNVTGVYVKTTLKKITLFMEDESQASVVFDKVTEEQISFIRLVPSLSKNPIQHRYLDDQCTALMKKIAKFYKQDTIRIVFSCSKFNKHSFVTLRKEPKYENESDKPSKTVSKMEAEVKCNNTVKASKNTEIGTKNTAIGTKNTEIRAKNIAFTVPNTITQAKNTETESKNTEKETKNTAIQSKVSAAKADNTVDRPKNTEMETKNTVNAIQKDDKKILSPTVGRVGKLMQSLSTPVNSQIGEKLMRQMGWDGGALGLREGGIIEPIIPALHIKPGAGFGSHLAPKPIQNTDRIEYRIYLFEKLLAFLQSPKAKINITFPKKLTQRDLDFTTVAIRQFNKRSPLGLNIPAEVALLDDIFKELMDDLRIQIAFDWIYVTEHTLYLTKKLGDPVVVKTKKKKNGINIQNTGENQVIDIIKQYNLEPLCPTPKSARKLATKLHFLEKIKEFLQTDKKVVAKDIKVDAELGKNNKMYIHRVISAINKKIGCSLSCELEKEKLSEIKNIPVDYHLSAEFNTCTLTLKKLYPQKLPAQTTTILKSKDVENTVIYVNNTAIKMSDLKNHCTENGEVDTCDYEFIVKSVKKIVSDENVTICEEDLVDTDLDKSKDSLELLDTRSGSVLLEVIEKKGKKEEKNDTENDYQDLKKINNNDIQNNYEKHSSKSQNVRESKEVESKENESKKEYSKYISIFCKNGDNITLELIKKVQTIISNFLDEDTFLPRLKCHGVKNGGLVYSCHNESSFNWLTKALGKLKVRILDTDFHESKRKMSMIINSFINEDFNIVFKRLKKYYKVLKTENWIVKSEKIFNNCAVYTVEMEAKDFEFICENKFSLYAGVDMIEFCIEWESDKLIYLSEL